MALRICPEAGACLQDAREVGGGCPPPVGGDLALVAVRGAQHEVGQPGVLQVDEAPAGVQCAAGVDAGAGVDGLPLLRGQQVAKGMAGEGKLLALEARPAERGAASGSLELLDVGVEQQDVGLPGRAIEVAVPLDPPAQLDDRAHGRGFDDGPVVAVVSPHFGDGRREDDEEVVAFRAVFQLVADARQREHGVGLVALERGVQRPLDLGPDQHGVAGVVGAQVNPTAFGGAQAVKAAGDVEERVDVGHPHEAEADPFAGDGVDAVMVTVQRKRLVAQQRGQLPADVGLAAGRVCAADSGDWHVDDGGAPPDFRGGRQPGDAAFDEGAVAGQKARAVRVFAMVAGGGAEFVEPGAAHVQRRAGAPAVALEFGPAGGVGEVQALHQCRWQGRRGQQHPAAEQAGPMYEAGEGREVGDVEVVGLVQHQVGRHEPQHWQDLVAAPGAFAGGHQVVDGAYEHRGVEQAGGLGVPALRAVLQPALEGAVLEAALVADVVVFGEELTCRFAPLAGQVTGAGLVVRMQCPGGGAAHQHGEIFGAEPEAFAVGVAGLQGEGAQPQGHREARPQPRVGEAVEDAGVGEGLAAAGRGQVDAEEAVVDGLFAQALGQVEGRVLPAEGARAAFAEALVAGDSRQAEVEARERLHETAGIHADADQMLVETLVELRCAVRGAGRVGVGRLAAAFDGVAVTAVAGLGRVVVVGQHQREPGEMDYVGAGEDRSGVGIDQTRAFQDGAGGLAHMLAPVAAVEGQALEAPATGLVPGIGVVEPAAAPRMDDAPR